MKRFSILVVALACVLSSSLAASARAEDEQQQSPPFSKAVVLDSGLPDIPECRGVLRQEIVDLVRAAQQDPEEIFEKWRIEKRSMMEESPAIECQSKLWKALRRLQSGLTGTNAARVPSGTEGFSLRSRDAATQAAYQVFAASLGANVNPAGGVEGYQGELQLAVDPKNPLHIVGGANSFYRDPAPECQSPTGGTANTYGTQALYGSSDGGQTWTYKCAPWPAALTGGVSGAAFWFGSDPAVAWDSATGRAYAVYMLISQNSSGTSAGSAIVIAKSDDVGQSWQNLGIVVNNINVASPFHDKEFVAVDNSAGPVSTKSHPGRIYVIWDADNVERVAWSDNGTSWTTVILPTPAVGTYDIGGDIKVGPDGTVYAIWNRLVYSGSTQTGERTVFSKSVDGGATWSTPIVIASQALLSFGTNNKPPAQESRGLNAFGSLGLDVNPASAYFGYLYFAYPDFPSGTTSGTNINVYLVRSTNGGTSWSTPLKVNDDAGTATQFFPWLAVDPTDGSVNVSWYDTRVDPTNNRKSQFFYARSSNGGISFEPNLLVTDNGGVVWRNAVDYSNENTTDNASRNANQYGDYSGIMAHDRRVVPFWTDTRSYFPAADTVSPSRREDAAAAIITNCSAPDTVAAPVVTIDPSCSSPSVEIAWSAPASWGTNATGGTYSVYRSTTSAFPTGSSPIASSLTGTSTVDTTGIVGVTYYYFVTAKNDCPGTALTPMSSNSAASNAIVFPACGLTFGNVSGVVQTTGGLPIAGATITAGTRSTTSDGTGAYVLLSLATGTHSITASATGYSSSTANGVVVSDGQTTTQDFALAVNPVAACFTDTTQADFQAGTATSLDLTSSPGSVKLALSGSQAIDQQNTTLGSSGNGVTTTTWEAQTFTAAASGNLTRLDLAMFCSACSGTTPNLTVDIRTVSAGLPTSTILATTTLNGFASGATTYYTATFSTPASITSGTTYAYVVRLAANPSTGTYATTRSNNNAYANGAWIQSTNSGASWTAQSQDLGFKVYITPATYQTAGNLVSALKDSAPVVGATPNWTTISWTAVLPASTAVKFQVAASNSSSGPFNFVGPDGTAATFFTTSGASLSQFNGNRYLKYKAFLSTSDTASTPTLNDVVVCSETVASCVPPATPTASNGGPYCEGSTISLSTPTVSGATYAWTGPNGFTSSLQNPTRSNATVADAGTYSVTITVSGCTSAAGTTNVVVNAIPATPTASNGGPYCEGSTIALSTPFVSGATYSWTGPNGFTSSLQNPTRSNATVADAGTYSVTITVNGCTSAAGTTNIVVNPTPATPTASNGGPYCEGATIALSTPFVSGATYSWTGPNGFISSLQNPTRSNATVADAGTYSVTITVNGCTSAAGTTNVVVNATPATPAASNGGPYCEGSTIALSTPTVSGATYAWTGPNGFTSSLQNPTRANATIADAGTYSVTITVNGCTSAAGTTNVVVNPIPATPTASNGGPYCEGSTIALSTPFVSGATYSWTGPNGFTSSLQNPTRSNATIADAGTYSVTIIVNGCTSAAGTTSVVVNPTPATPTASNGGPYCEGSTIALSTPFVSGATYSWTGPNGFIASLQNPTRSNATVADAGTYSVTITVNGCTSAAGTTNVVVNAIPATPTASNSGPYCEGSTIALSTPFVSGATYSWTGPNGFTSTLQNPTRASATVADAGTYSVTITVNGCTSAAGTTNVVVNATPPQPAITFNGTNPFCYRTPLTVSSSSATGNQWFMAGTPLAGETGQTLVVTRELINTYSINGSAVVTVTVTANGCSATSDPKIVTVLYTPPPVIVANGPTGFCEGGSVQLGENSGGEPSGQWYRDGSPIDGATSATYVATTSGSYTFVNTFYVGCPSDPSNAIVVTTSPVPATPTASNGGPYCESSTIALATPTVSGATYAWSGPNGFTSALQNPTRTNATVADAGTYSVTVTVNGCPSAAGTTSVVVNPTPATPTASNGGPYCEGSTLQLSTPFVSGATYAWTGPNGFTSSAQNPTRSNATTADAGTYSVTVTVNGCTSAAGTTNVVVNTVPATPTASNGGPYCEGSTLQLSTPFVSGATYAWTGPNGFISAAQNPTRSNATLADAGTYSVTITVNGCTSAAGTTNVVVNSAPATPAASNGGPYCENATIALSTPTIAGATYAWTGPNGFTSSAQNPTRSNATVADAGTYSVTITVNGCSSAAGTTNVVVNATPATPTASNGGPYCENATIALSTPAVAGATYSWTGPNGFTSSSQNPTRSNATMADAGTYSVTVTVNGCTSAAGTTNVVVNATPATPTASNGGPYCENATIALSTPAVSGATYAWTGPNGFTSSSQNPTRANATVADAGTYSVTITVNGCTSAAGTTNVVVNARPATPTASNGGPYCEGSTISLSTPTVAGATYSWTGPNGFTSSLQNPTRSSATIADGGTYSVTITVNGCTSAAGTTNVVVNAKPATPTASNGGPYCQNTTIALSTPAVAGATYSWTGPNGFTSSLQNPTRANATVGDAGTYSVTVTVNGCTSAAGSTNVVVNATPARPTISAAQPTTFCAGGSVTLQSSSASGNQWLLNGNPIAGATSQTYNATVAGDYTVVVTTSGCPSQPSAATTVTITPNPSATITTAATAVSGSVGNTASVADAGTGASYAWSITNGTLASGQGTRSVTFTAGAVGTLTLQVTVTNAGGCTDTKSANVTISAAPPAVTITSVNPGSAPWIGGTPITITGTGFQNGASVTIGGTAATSVVVVSATQITCKTPAHAPGTVDVVVTNPDATTATLIGGLVITPQRFDPNGDHQIDPADIFYLVNYLFVNGPPPAGDAGMLSGDANGDGVVDPADIFFAVNYLFVGGPPPAVRTPRVGVTSTGDSFGGTITLGAPLRRGDRAFVPVLVEAAPGSAAPQAMSLRVRVEPAIELSIARAGSAKTMQPVFEIERHRAGELSYLLAFDPKTGPLTVDGRTVVAEIELPPNVRAVRLELDPQVTLLTDGGARKATVSDGNLKLEGLHLRDREAGPQQRGDRE